MNVNYFVVNCCLITIVDSPEKNEASFVLACPSKCIEDSMNKDENASANLFEDNVDHPSVISCAKTPLSENEQQMRTKEVLIGSVQHPEATHGAGTMVQSVSLHMQYDSSNNGESSSFEVSSSTGLSEGVTRKVLQSDPAVQVHKESTVCFCCVFVLSCQFITFYCSSPPFLILIYL